MGDDELVKKEDNRISFTLHVVETVQKPVSLTPSGKERKIKEIVLQKQFPLQTQEKLRCKRAGNGTIFFKITPSTQLFLVLFGETE